jgi:hypothetical protein
VRPWARRATRPRQPADPHYQSAYLLGAVCPARGVDVGLAMTYADTHAMLAYLDEISHKVASGAHAALLLDRTAWHTSDKLTIPRNITLILLPLRSPELNPAFAKRRRFAVARGVENIWQYLQANWLSHRVFEDYHDIIDAACDAWNKFTAKPGIITSIGSRQWAHIGQN